MYVIIVSILSIAILCGTLTYCFWEDVKNNRIYNVNLRFFIGLIIEIILIIFPTFWLTNFIIFSKPLDYDYLKENGVSINYDEHMIVAMPQNIEDTILLFTNRKEYILKFGEIIEPLKEAKPENNWNRKEIKKNDTIFSSSRKE